MTAPRTPSWICVSDRCTSSEWIWCSAKVTATYVRKYFPPIFHFNHIHALYGRYQLSCRTSTRPQDGACSPRWRSKILTFQSVPVVCSQGNESEYHATIFIFFSFYHSAALPLITNEGYNDLWCAKSLFSRGWKWEDGSAVGREWYSWVQRSCYLTEILCILIWSWI